LEHANVHEEIIQRCRQGDNSAYHQLYTLYKRSMYNACFRIVNSKEEAEDVLQESFVSAFKNMEHYRGDSTFGAWLKRIVVNRAITQVKKKKIERFPQDDNWDVKEEPEPDIFEGFPSTVEQVNAAIQRLPDGYRMVLSLYLLEGYDHGEIGEILGISESTSKSQFNRSKKKLKELLQGGEL
jgi:RNA polymerase sigma factor (sigma-70 family)